jgi:NAD(P)-dependent dehydrogenase (short-subunit alcohol dehydrogenase family)
MIKAGRGGRIVNVLSTETIRPTGMLAPYGAAKAGLMAVTQLMAVELGQHAFTSTRSFPARR